MIAIRIDTSQFLSDGRAYRWLGLYTPPRGEQRYIVAVPGMVQALQGNELGQSVALGLLPAKDHWFALFPGKRGKVDTTALRAGLVRECQAVGEYRGDTGWLISERRKPRKGTPLAADP